MLKRKRDPDPTEEHTSYQRKNPRFLKGKQVSVYWAPSDIWAPAIIDKQVRTGIIVKWLSDGTTTLILDAFVDAVIHKNERLRMEQKKEAREKNKEAEEKKSPKCTGAGIQNKEEEDFSEEDDHSNDSNSDSDSDDDDDEENAEKERDYQVYVPHSLQHSLQPAAMREEEEEEEEGPKNNKRTFGLKDEVKFKGVTKTGKKFQAQITVDGKNQKHGTYDTPKEAAQAYDRAAIQAGRPTSKLNFLDQVPKSYKPKKKKLASNNTTGYRGVCNISGNRFTARIKIDGRTHNIGVFATTKEAAIAFDLAAIQANRSTSELNFPDMIHKLPIKIIGSLKKRKKRKSSTTKNNNNSSTGHGQASREFPEKSNKKTGGKILREFPEIRTSTSVSYP